MSPGPNARRVVRRAIRLPRSTLSLGDLMHPEIRYAKSGDVNIAYQVVGNGPLDLVFVPGFVSHAEACWEEPRLARFLRRLSSFSRLIAFDKRGTGMSDPVTSVPAQQERLDDIRAVMDAPVRAARLCLGCPREAR